MVSSAFEVISVALNSETVYLYIIKANRSKGREKSASTQKHTFVNFFFQMAV